MQTKDFICIVHGRCTPTPVLVHFCFSGVGVRIRARRLVLVAFAPRIILFSLAPVVVCLAPEAALAISEARLGCIVCPVRDKVCRNQPAGILDFSKSTVRGNIFTDRAPLFSARISVFSSRPNLPYRKPVTSSYIKQQVFKLHHCQHE